MNCSNFSLCFFFFCSLWCAFSRLSASSSLPPCTFHFIIQFLLSLFNRVSSQFLVLCLCSTFLSSLFWDRSSDKQRPQRFSFVLSLSPAFPLPALLACCWRVYYLANDMLRCVCVYALLASHLHFRVIVWLIDWLCERVSKWIENQKNISNKTMD